ncbi:Na+/H+ antiporter subunit E [Ilumatobacter nonamiensis]|uniref:Na+/H+ antiporter subunit E n=1 Tax=Ilumatobacter nonamiensis TaxID=467093 RepID=UPI0003476C69|nr:Na+/H+ antiporter subunit E [Ilumatobacter nonamiensis]
MTSARRPRWSWLATGLILVAVWCALWGSVSWANLLSGAIVAVVILAVVNRRPGEDYERIRIIPAIRLSAWFTWQLVVASATVSWEILTPTQHVRQGIVQIPLRTESARVVTLVANIISLIPGTLTLEVAERPSRLYIHVLHLRDIADVRAEVEHLEDLVVRAVAPSLLPLEPPADALVSTTDEGSRS